MIRGALTAAMLATLSMIAGCSPGASRRGDEDSTTAGIEGRWEGTASAFGAEAPLTVDFTRSGDSLRATTTMDVETLWLEHPLANVRYHHPDVHFEFPDRAGNNGVFDGVRKGETIEGETRKGGRSLPMRFRRVSREVPARAVALDTIVFRSADGTQLEGTLHRPLTAGPHPAVVFIHGSGPGTREDFVYLADRFVRQGIAAFAYDKRGSGRSRGDLTFGSYTLLADDVEAAVNALASRSAVVDADRIAICGISEGGWVAPIVASRPGSRVAAVVGVVASGGTYAVNALYQNELRLRGRNATEAQIAEYRRLTGLVNDHVRARGASESGALQRALDAAYAAGWADATDLPRRVPVGRDLDRMRWRVIDYDPRPLWEKVRVPTMLVLGGRDRNANPVEAESVIPAALRRGGNQAVSVVVYRDATHDLMIEPEPGKPFHFPSPPAGYPDTLATWLRGALRGAATASPPR